MTTETLYHVTDASNVDSIMAEGLKPNPADSDRLVFLAGSADEAARVGEIYDTIDEAVVLEAEVMEHKIMDDPEPHGDIDSYAHRGSVPAHDVEVIQG